MSWTDIKNFDVQFKIPLSYSHRSHKLCRLPNGILTLLVSDPTDTTSVCSLTVASGSHNDPRGIPGIAHLCEHMLFSGGSRSYPDPDTYHQLISKNSGSHNAFTTGEQTTFYFQLPNMHKEGEMEFDLVMEVFSSFFKEPLFSSIALNKEIYAIQSEHEGNMSNINKMLYHATRLLANEDHPFSQFSTGNIHSLSNIPTLQNLNLKKMLFKYFIENYSPNNMTLCIRGPQSVNILTKLAMTKFGNIKKNYNLGKSKIGSLVRSPSKLFYNRDFNYNENFNILNNVWRPKYGKTKCFNRKENFIFVKSNKKPTIRFLYPISDKNTRFSSRDIEIFSKIWCELFGDESEGSICLNFKEKGWITECIAYTSQFSVGNIGLILEFTLTRSGLQDIDNLIYHMLNNVIDSFSNNFTKELSIFLYENSVTEYINFLCKEAETSSLDFCSSLTELLQSDLQQLNCEFLFKGSPNLIELNEDDFENLLGTTQWWVGQAVFFQSFLREFMASKNMRIILLGSNIKETKLFKEKTDNDDFQADFYFEFEFIKKRVKFENLFRDVGAYKGSITISPPSHNIYIPKCLDNMAILQQMFMESSFKSQFSALQPQMHTDPRTVLKPKLVNKSRNYEMWYLPMGETQTTTLRNKINKSIISFELKSMTLEPSPMNTIHLEVLTEVINVLMSSKLYASQKLGYCHEIATSVKGEVSLRFTVSGFDDGVEYIIATIIETIHMIINQSGEVILTNEIIRKSRVIVRSKYETAVSENCVKLACLGLLILLEKNIWTLEDRLDALEEIENSDFFSFCRIFFGNDQDIYLTLFIQGGLPVADQVNYLLNSKLTHHLNGSRCGTPIEVPFRSTHMLSSGTNDHVKLLGNKDDPSSSIVYFIQTGSRDNKYTYALTSFTEYLFSSTLIPYLRHERQIGYVVLGGMRIMIDSIGLHITVMSSGDPMNIEEAVNDYLIYLEEVVLKPKTNQQFFIEYVTTFLEIINKDGSDGVNNGSGEANLLNDIAPNIQNGSCDSINSNEMKTHMRLRNQINDREYEFETDNGKIEKKWISSLTKAKYLQFFQETISIKSKTRSKVSIMISSSMLEKEIMNKQIFLQLETFLKMKGFVVKSQDLKEIVDGSNGAPAQILKLLFQYFRSRGEGWKLCSVIIREVGKMLSSTMKTRYGNMLRLGKPTEAIVSRQRTSVVSTIPSHEVPNIKSYHLAAEHAPRDRSAHVTGLE